MLTIELPDDLAERLAAEAARRGIAAEELALQGVRRVLPLPEPVARKGNLLEYLGDVVGSFDGDGEANSQDCGRKFAEGLSQGLQAKP